MATTKAKRKVARAKTVPMPAAVPETVPAPVSTTLSHEASELVRWYGSITHHNERSTVEGAVFGTLTRAKEAYEQDPGSDEAFNWLLDDVLASMNDDCRQSVHLQYGGGYSVQLSIQASALLARYSESGDDPRDIINGAVESLLSCGLDDTSIRLSDAIAEAKRVRLAAEADRQQRNAATAAFLARKEAA